MSEFLHPDLASSHPALGNSKLPLGVLRRLQEWITGEYKNLSTMIQNDVTNCQFLRIMKSSPHPVPGLWSLSSPGLPGQQEDSEEEEEEESVVC